MSPKNGGPAFPVVNRIDSESGMSLLEYFAGQALQLFSVDTDGLTRLLAGAHPRHDLAAKFCYDLAEAMLAERERREDKA